MHGSTVKTKLSAFFAFGRLKNVLFLATALFVFLIFGANKADASALSIQPSTGSFAVDSTFDVSVILDTDNASINALEVNLKFPADKLQLVSPKTSLSVIELWTSQPKFNNVEGTISLQGGIPGGITANDALIATLTFRVKTVGTASIRILDTSRVLLNDGAGTDSLTRKGDGVFTLRLPAPAGPIVASSTHSDQSKWYPVDDLVLSWDNEAVVAGYSYVLNKAPVTIPDDIQDSRERGIRYADVASGQHFFHIKSIRDGVWGGVTHYAVNIDVEKPADFVIEVTPSANTSSRNPIIQFNTSDSLSGVEYYEIAVISLTSPDSTTGDQSLFIEAESPYAFKDLPLGSYDVIVRAYDSSGNYREKTQKLSIVTGVFTFIREQGLSIRGITIIPWKIFFIIIGVLILGLALLIYRLKNWRERLLKRFSKGDLPNKISKELEELHSYRKKYGKIVTALVFFSLLFPLGSALAQGKNVHFSPPLITTVSRDISNREIYYVGGKTDTEGVAVTIFTQNLTTGETGSNTLISDEEGNWFYRHDGFLSPGDYLLWTQAAIDEQVSPPSPQIKLTVRKTALQFGSSRFSIESIYLIISLILFAIVLTLAYFSVHHALHIKRAKEKIKKEVREAEESLKRGFAVLKRDIEAEIEIVKKAKLKGELAYEEKRSEEELLKDLEEIEKKVGKEIWDIRIASQE